MNRRAEEVEQMQTNREPVDRSNEFISGGDDDECSDDEDTYMKELRSGQPLIRRNSSIENFLSRSERMKDSGKDKPPPPSEASKSKIQFRIDLEDIKIVEQIDDAVKDSYWMTLQDFEKIETDLKLTEFRWENAQSGKIAFDHNNNSMRGLEFMDRDAQSQKDMTRYEHHRSVLGEIHKQKLDHGEVVDWDSVRSASERISMDSMNHATEMGKQDEIAHKQAWGEIPTASSPSTVAPVHHERKKRRSVLFWKKS